MLSVCLLALSHAALCELIALCCAVLLVPQYSGTAYFMAGTAVDARQHAPPIYMNGAKKKDKTIKKIGKMWLF